MSEDTGRMVVSDVYLAVTEVIKMKSRTKGAPDEEKEGNTVITSHTAWDRQRFIDSAVAAHVKEGRRCRQATRDEYRAFMGYKPAI